MVVNHWKISARIKLTNLVLATLKVGDNGMSLSYAIMPHHNILIIACPSKCSTPVSTPGQRSTSPKGYCNNNGVCMTNCYVVAKAVS